MRGLAVAWLRGYLTRSSRDDDRWESAIANLSSPELVDELRKSGPDSVGADALSSWQVVDVEPVVGIDLPVDTPSRVTLSYAASITDGRRTVEKPFTVSCYRQADGRWLVGLVDQPYSSDG